MADEQKYLITYILEPELHPDGVEKKDVPEERGACDAFVFLSLLYPDDGSFHMKLITLDGRRPGEFPEVTSDDIWKCWAVMTSMVSADKTLNAEKREFCDFVFEMVRALTMPDHPGADRIRVAIEEYRKIVAEVKARMS